LNLSTDMTAVRSIDLVIPVRNEIDNLSAALDSVECARRVLEDDYQDAAPVVRVVVVDGGSEDGTLALARERGVCVILAERAGRGHQLAEGVVNGDGELILMMHADARLTADALSRLVNAMNTQGATWGILGFRYDRNSWLIRWIHLTNRLRFCCIGLAFGDQGIFVRRETLEAVGGIPRLVLMEDIELSLRLRGFGPRLNLGACQRMSARRFDGGGCGYMMKVVYLSCRWLVARAFGAAPDALAIRTYEQYYGKPPA
jgi:glycosyltransferase involved in cell wall biosynthesis